MTDRPILFSAPMVRALLDGTKTQTRRMLKHGDHFPDSCTLHEGAAILRNRHTGLRQDVPLRFAPGDRLWVKEAHTFGYDYDDEDKPVGDEPRVFYAATECPRWYDTDTDEWLDAPKWKPSIFMPRRASRLTLLVTDVRVQRLQDISEADALAEGVEPINSEGPNHYQVDIGVGWLTSPTAADAYAALWCSIHDDDAWAANPWVVAVSFTVEQRNIDA